MGSDYLESLLAARDERALMQADMLKSFCCVLQISLNIPGMPKRIQGDEDAINRGEEILLEFIGANPAERLALCNNAGYTVMFGLRDVNPLELKKTAVLVEELEPWCRVLDIDVISTAGHISRTDIGFLPRRCMLCEQEAKVCARLRSHSVGELRDKVQLMLSIICL